MTTRRIHAREYTAAEIEQMQPGPLLDWLANQADPKNTLIVETSTGFAQISNSDKMHALQLWLKNAPDHCDESISSDPGAAMRAIATLQDSFISGDKTHGEIQLFAIGSPSAFPIEKGGRRWSCCIGSRIGSIAGISPIPGPPMLAIARALALYARAKQLEQLTEDAKKELTEAQFNKAS